jgi:transcriptional repressor NrdR
MVVKRTGALDPFDPAKVRRGVVSALADRPVPIGEVDRLIAEVCEVVMAARTPVTTEQIGREVLQRLRTLDEVAYLRFASVYKEFQGASDFEREVAALEAES